MWKIRVFKNETSNLLSNENYIAFSCFLVFNYVYKIIITIIISMHYGRGEGPGTARSCNRLFVWAFLHLSVLILKGTAEGINNYDCSSYRSCVVQKIWWRYREREMRTRSRVRIHFIYVWNIYLHNYKTKYKQRGQGWLHSSKSIINS